MPSQNSNIPQAYLQHLVDSSLISFLDSQVCVHMGDGSFMLGVLASFDSIYSIVLMNATRRWIFDQEYAQEENLGTTYILGQDVALVASRNDDFLNDLSEVSVEELKEKMHIHKREQYLLKNSA